jgi:hypothetical protein
MSASESALFEMRQGLLDQVRALTQELAESRRETAAYLRNLTATQERCSELLLEARSLRANLVLPGWTCASGSFNGAAKEVLAECRHCGKARPT